jgi:hypothetical protein
METMQLAPLPVHNDIEKYVRDRSDGRKVVILGGGPVGMMAAILLRRKWSWLDVMLLDNRSPDGKVRAPFTRTRLVQTCSDVFALAVPQYFCGEKIQRDDTMCIGVRLNDLESILYSVLYTLGVPMFFSREYTYLTDVETRLCPMIDVVLDATGGRLASNRGGQPTSSHMEVSHEATQWITSVLSHMPDLLMRTPAPNRIVMADMNEAADAFFFTGIFLKTLPSQHDVSFHVTTAHDVTLIKTTLVPSTVHSRESFKTLALTMDNPTMLHAMLDATTCTSFEVVSVADTRPYHAVQMSQIRVCGRHKYLYVLVGDSVLRGSYYLGTSMSLTIPLLAETIDVMTAFLS